MNGNASRTPSISAIILSLSELALPIPQCNSKVSKTSQCLLSSNLMVLPELQWKLGDGLRVPAFNYAVSPSFTIFARTSYLEMFLKEQLYNAM